jgi:hypothetical protein
VRGPELASSSSAVDIVRVEKAIVCVKLAAPLLTMLQSTVLLHNSPELARSALSLPSS